MPTSPRLQLVLLQFINLHLQHKQGFKKKVWPSRRESTVFAERTYQGRLVISVQNDDEVGDGQHACRGDSERRGKKIFMWNLVATHTLPTHRLEDNDTTIHQPPTQRSHVRGHDCSNDNRSIWTAALGTVSDAHAFLSVLKWNISGSTLGMYTLNRHPLIFNYLERSMLAPNMEPESPQVESLEADIL